MPRLGKPWHGGGPVSLSFLMRIQQLLAPVTKSVRHVSMRPWILNKYLFEHKELIPEA